MKLAKFSLIHRFTFLIIFTSLVLACEQKNEKYDYETIENAPIDIKTYTLKNGLKLYLIPTKDEPKIETRVIIKAGSTKDPENSRGLAHYLEHLLFNGTDQIGAFNFKKEKPLLDEIERLFEAYREEKDIPKKKKIYKKIDSLSHEASKYSSQNEYSDIMSKLGISYMNAFTRDDMTGYMNEIPSNQLEKWIIVEAERFKNPQFRGFHIELETVYEEMNTIIDNGFRFAKKELDEATFSNEYFKHPIGTIEGIKNPSLTDTKQFFNTYYVPNNMAIILAGDFDPDNATKLIEKHFGSMEAKPIPKDSKTDSPLLKSNIEMTINAPGEPSVAMNFVHVAPSDEKSYLASFVEMLIHNGNVGIVNIGDSFEKSQWLNSSFFPKKDFIVHYMEGAPKKGVTLEQLKNSILNDIERVKTGNFPDWLITAVANDLKSRFSSMIDSNNGLVYIVSEAFAHEVPLQKVFEEQKKYDKVTKSDIMEYAKKHYKHYSVIYKQEGSNETPKVEKPEISSISDVNKGKISSFAKEIESINAIPITPVLADFEKNIRQFTLNNGTTINFVKNKTNELFNLRIVFNQGSKDKLLKFATEYQREANSNQYSSQEFKNELYKLGCSYNLVSNSNNTSLYINGLTKNLKESIALVYDFLSNLKPDPTVMKSIHQQQLTKIKNDKSNKSRIIDRVINYVRYGTDSYQSILTEEDLKQINSPDKVVAKLASLFNYNYELYLYSANSDQTIIDTFNTILPDEKPSIAMKKISSKKPRKQDGNHVYLIDFKSTQTDIIFDTNLASFDPSNISMNYLLQNYTSGIINDELREKRGLAYSAYSRLSYPYLLDGTIHFNTRMGTQADKYKEAIKINYDLIRKMPLDSSKFTKSKLRLEGIWNSWRITKNALLYHYETSLNRGFDHDYRKQYYEVFPSLTMEDLKDYYNKQIKDNSFNLIIIGDLSKIDTSFLKKYGDIHILTKEEVFGEK